MDGGPGDTLAAAVGVGARACVALVGGGGKTTALLRLAREADAAGRRVVATTTTSMYLRELAAVAPVVLRGEQSEWIEAVGRVVASSRPAAVALGEIAGGKVTGLTTGDVDALWASGAADLLVVEADGSRGLPYKAFAPHEPQVPASADIVVVVAGLDVLGRPLTDRYVHRAGLLAATLQVPVGTEMDIRLLAEGLRRQIAHVRTAHACRRCVVVLNKAEEAEARAAGRAVAQALLRDEVSAPEIAGQTRRPDAVVVGSLRSGPLHVDGARPTVSAVVLAAGRATRMGGAKLTLPVGGRPMVQRVVDAALGSQAVQVVVVVGHEAEAVLEALTGRPVTTVLNPDFADGMSTSLRAGLGAVDPGTDGVVVLLGDQPFVSTALVDALIDGFATTGKVVVRPSRAGRAANPVLVSAALIPELLAERGDVGGRRVIERHAEDVLLVPVCDPRELADIDSPQEYEEARET